MNHRTYPKGYRQVGAMDFVRNRRELLTVNGLALAVAVAMIAFGIWRYPFAPTWNFMRANVWTWFLLAAMCFAYISLHELTHGALMHLLSGVKPKYGFKLCYAYAGSRAYFDRRSHNVIALAPLLVWGIALFALERALPAEWFWLFYVVQISNVSGSMGDVYCVFALWKYPSDILIQDTGTRMRIFAPRPKGEERS